MMAKEKHKKKRGTFNQVTLIIVLLLIIALPLTWYWGRSSAKVTSIKQFTVARDAVWRPFDFLGKERQISAFSDDLLVAIAREENIGIEILSVTSPLLLSGLSTGSYDGVLTTLQPRASLGEGYLFSQPYYRFGSVLLVNVSSPVTDISQIRKSGVVGIQRGSPLLFDRPADPSLYFVPYDNLLIALENLTNGSLDAVIAGALPAYTYVNSLYRGKLRVVSIPMSDEGLRLAVRHDHTGQLLVDHFNHGLAVLKASGVYAALLKKWDLVDPDQVFRPPAAASGEQ